MTESEARMVLGVKTSADKEDIVEAYEEAVFEQASFFMRRVFIPKLAKARIARLEKIDLASKSLGLDVREKDHSILIDFSSVKGHQEVLEAYNQSETQIKLGLANTSSSAEAINLYESWVHLFKAYTERFISFCEIPQKDTLGVRLTEAPIFVEYRNSSQEQKKQLISMECARLIKLKN
ncbi:hypothetical protein O3Q51_05815 [Cryomorphaceae bacterium 1068]|nr:hypothetical protein [Cryomorphaceae bacterium 1068]